VRASMSRGAGSWNLLLRRDNELIRRLQEEAKAERSFFLAVGTRAVGLAEIICIN